GRRQRQRRGRSQRRSHSLRRSQGRSSRQNPRPFVHSIPGSTENQIFKLLVIPAKAGLRNPPGRQSLGRRRRREGWPRLASRPSCASKCRCPMASRLRQAEFKCDNTVIGAMARDETGIAKAKEVRPRSACRLSLPLPARTRRRVHGYLPQAARDGYLWRNLRGSPSKREGGDRAVPGGDAEGWRSRSTPCPRSRLADRSAGAGRRRLMRALPALSGRAVIAALERTGFKVPPPYPPPLAGEGRVGASFLAASQ